MHPARAHFNISAKAHPHPHAHTRTHTHAHTRTHPHAHVHAPACAHAHLHARAHAHTRTRTHRDSGKNEGIVQQCEACHRFAYFPSYFVKFCVCLPCCSWPAGPCDEVRAIPSISDPWMAATPGRYDLRLGSIREIQFKDDIYMCSEMPSMGLSIS